ncbi:hypothetical protein AVEN_228942-1 [Araneus ventricosus]|uniref:Uncharacterized protein n=1 Tax=Araneus ventricosus TaxID=182803 RepID=A0A4Y2IFQ1_ARAVE|nr:hypothetical protein AVEN_228942-1 [Araneus ventricosus]
MAGRYKFATNSIRNLVIEHFKDGKSIRTIGKLVKSIEWQKRRLPHIRILLWLEDKLRLNETDNIISAEISDPSSDKELLDINVKNMIHVPCSPTENTEFIDFVYNEALTKVKDQVVTITGKDLSSFVMRVPRRTDEISNAIMKELDYDNEELQQRLNELIPWLKPEQKPFLITFCSRLKVAMLGFFSTGCS